MTTVAAPARVAPPPRLAVRFARCGPRRRDRISRSSRRGRASGGVGTLLAVFTVFALVSAVVFHVMLAQNQLQLDRLNTKIATEQRAYEQHRLTTSLLASPQRIIQEAERLGLVVPAEPAQYLYVPGAPMPSLGDGATADTLADWTKAKPSLGAQQP